MALDEIGSSLSINYSHSEPHFAEPLPVVCRRKPNFVTAWQLRTIDDGDIPGNVFDYFERHTSDGLVYIVDLELSRKAEVL